MWFKLVGALLIIIAGAYGGFQMAQRCNERPRQIRQIIGCMVSLKSSITYFSMPLSSALVKCTGGIEGVVADFFHKISSLIEGNHCLKPLDAIKHTLSSQLPGFYLEANEKEILESWGANLGNTGMNEQEKYFDLVISQLLAVEQEAINLREKNVRMYRYLGVCGGVAVAILLL